MDDLFVLKYKFKSINDLFGFKEKVHIIAGPCAIESYQQMEDVAKILVKNDIKIIRGGAYKPRTSPHSFQGLGLDGLKIFDEIRNTYGLKAISEIIDPRDVELGLKYTDIIQIGSRNMQNYSLLKEVGKTQHPVMLKRGMMSTIEEFILAAEYIISEGNTNIIMCERGIRTFESMTRNTLDISCIALIKNRTSLPIIADLSHSLGRIDIVLPVAKSVIAAGADGIMIEICPLPSQAFSDGFQQLSLDQFDKMVTELKQS